jgi:hypothetical protein
MSSAPPPGYVPPGYVPPGYVPPAPGIPPPSSGPRGCWRTGLIGCGIAALVVVLCGVAAMLYLRRNPNLFTDWAMKQVDAHMASDVTEQEKKDLHDAYAAYRDRMRAGTANPEALQRMQRVFMSGSNNEITREQVRELTAAFRRAAGLPPLTPSGEPGQATTPSSSPGGIPTAPPGAAPASASTTPAAP